MSIRDSQTPLDVANSIGPALVLERLRYHARKGQPYALLADERSFRAVLPQTIDLLIFQLAGHVWAERVQEQSVEVRFESPRGWWQHLRAQVRFWACDHAPRWLPARLRLRLRMLRIESVWTSTTVEFEHFVKYPELMPPEQRALRYEVTGSHGVDEIRINKSWQSVVHVPGWWHA